MEPLSRYRQDFAKISKTGKRLIQSLYEKTFQFLGSGEIDAWMNILVTENEFPPVPRLINPTKDNHSLSTQMGVVQNSGPALIRVDNQVVG